MNTPVPSTHCPDGRPHVPSDWIPAREGGEFRRCIWCRAIVERIVVREREAVRA